MPPGTTRGRAAPGRRLWAARAVPSLYRNIFEKLFSIRCRVLSNFST